MSRVGKLGVQTQQLDRAVLDFCLRANVGVFKSICPQPVDLLRELKAALPECIFIYRWVGGQALDDPAKNARDAYNGIMPHAAEFPYDYIEAYNQVGLWDDGPPYNQFTVELTGLLHQTGQKLLAYSFSVGNPPGYATFPYEEDPAEWMRQLEQQWGVYHDGLRAADGGAFHQYKLPRQDDKFTLLRHRLVQQILPPDLKGKPKYLTEFGLDDVANPGESGWRGSSWNWTAERYAKWLIETWRRIKHEVAGATIFVCGGKGWDSFEILGQPVIADAIRQANEEGEEMAWPWRDRRDSLLRHPTNKYARRPKEKINGMVWHHSAIAAPVPVERLAEAFVNNFGWPGLAYHLYVDNNGIAHLALDLEEMGSHASNDNDHTVGICIAGRFLKGVTPTPGQIDTATAVALALMEEYPQIVNVWAHRDLSATACPGWVGGFEKWKRALLGGEPTELERLRERVKTLELQKTFARTQASKIVNYLKGE